MFLTLYKTTRRHILEDYSGDITVRMSDLFSRKILIYGDRKV